MTEFPGAGSALALIGQIARILNSGLAADESLRAVAATLKSGLPASIAVIWRRETHGSRVGGGTRPTREDATPSHAAPPPTGARAGPRAPRGSEVGRPPIWGVPPRQPAEQLRAEFDRVFRAGEVHQEEVEIPSRGPSRVYRISRLPMRLAGGAG